ncbi:MAG: NYN domain-containing protein [Candidatus Cloacimonetes bacterium]|nr:NYN domain-containing protein [Candidatus Cloacimonadota bacterium]
MSNDNKGVIKVGIYIDVSNIAQNGGYGMHYDILRDFACRTHGIAMRLNAYVAFDEQKAKESPEYYTKSNNFHCVLRDYGFKVIIKKVKWYFDENNNKIGKANADLDMAVDALSQSDRLDYVLLATGDGDFTQVVKTLQNRGCRVEVLAFKNISSDLKREADVFTSGYLVPGLIDTDGGDQTKVWGEVGSRVRGICYLWFREKGYGFFRFIKKVDGSLWVYDTRKDDSAYSTIFVHESRIPEIVDINTLPNRDTMFEFTIGKWEKGLQALDVKAIYKY